MSVEHVLCVPREWALSRFVPNSGSAVCVILVLWWIVFRSLRVPQSIFASVCWCEARIGCNTHRRAHLQTFGVIQLEQQRLNACTLYATPELAQLVEREVDREAPASGCAVSSPDCFWRCSDLLD